MEAYTYEALPLHSPAFRLLTLLPSDDEDAPLVCSISEYELPPPRPYTALSYVWGKEEKIPTHTVTLLDTPSSTSGRYLGITPNLNMALRHLRGVSPRTLWVDAICINQKDNKEKSRQVPLMAQIYRGATEVIAWLGEAADDGDAALSAVQVLSHEWVKRYAAWEAREEIDPDTTISYSEAFDHSQNLLCLLRRPYFRRVWIIQEIGMSGSRAIVQCGAKMARWEELVYACAFAVVTRAALISPEGITFAMSIDRTRGVDACNIFERPPDELSDKLLSVLCRYRNFDAKDPRDKVFALLNLASDDAVTKDQRLLPDYDKDTSSVYRDAAVGIIDGSKSLEILRTPIIEQPTGAPSLQLPSWVPDWSAKTETMSLDLMSLNEARSDSSAKIVDTAQFRFSPDHNELTVKTEFCSIRIKEIGAALSRKEPSPDRDLSALEMNRKQRAESKVLLQWEELAGAHPASHSKPYRASGLSVRQTHEQEETVGEAFRRTLLFGRDYKYTDTNQSDTDNSCARDFSAWSNAKMANYRRLWRCGLLESETFLRFSFGFQIIGAILIVLLNHLSPSRSGNEMSYERAARFADAVAASTVGRRFFVTEDGLYGMGPAGLEKGDKIVLVRGVSVPVVVRNISGRSDRNKQKWRLVGDCYIHSERFNRQDLRSREREEDLTLV